MRIPGIHSDFLSLRFRLFSPTVCLFALRCIFIRIRGICHEASVLAGRFRGPRRKLRRRHAATTNLDQKWN